MQRRKPLFLDNIIFSETYRLTDKRSFEFLFRELYAPLCRTIFKVVKDKDVAEDIAQDAFFILWLNKDEVTVSVKSYLYRSALNKAFNYLKKSKKFVETTEGDLTEFEYSGNTTEEQLDFFYAEKEVNEAIEALPPACKAIFLMSRTDEMSYKEIAESLQISIKTVENQISKALKILRSKLSGLAILFLVLKILNF